MPMTSIARACTSYLPKDVTLLLEVISASELDSGIVTQDVANKERLIQAGQRHYSQMLTLEHAPSSMHELLYQQALSQGKGRMASDIASLANQLRAIFALDCEVTKPLILISLVRAGLPVGVLLQRALADTTQLYHLPSKHYGVSIIRDRGLDPVALAQILADHPNSPLVFVDGWTGKGAIYSELERSLASFNHPEHPHHLSIFHQGIGVIPLVTLADPAGVAWLAASSDDWLMPASLLNSTISGLISRSIYREPFEGLHRCVIYDCLAAVDHSRPFVDTIDQLRRAVPINRVNPLTPQLVPRFATRSIIDSLAERFGIDNRNRIKPTIAEATRAVLRREPECVLVNDAKHPSATALLRHLCAEKQVPIYQDSDIAPYTAVTLIKKK